MAVDGHGDDVCQIGVRIDALEPAGLDKGGDAGPVPGTAVRTGEEGILPRHRQRADRALDDVIVDLDAAVAQKGAGPSQRESA